MWCVRIVVGMENVEVVGWWGLGGQGVDGGMEVLGIIGWWWFIVQGQEIIDVGIMVWGTVDGWRLCGSGGRVTSGCRGVVVVCAWMQAHAESPGVWSGRGPRGSHDCCWSWWRCSDSPSGKT